MRRSKFALFVPQPHLYFLRSPPVELLIVFFNIVRSPPSFRAFWVSCLFVFLSSVFTFLRCSTYHCTPPASFVASGRMADVRVWVCLIRSSCMNTNTTPPMTFGSLGGGFFRATVFRVSCTLHPYPPCDPCCRASFNFPTWAVHSMGSPTPSFRTVFLRSYFGPIYPALFPPLFPTWHLAYV